MASSGGSSGRPSFELSRNSDVATVPENTATVAAAAAATHNKPPAPEMAPLPASCPPGPAVGHQDYTGVLNMAMAQAASKPAGVLGHPHPHPHSHPHPHHHLYTPYGTEQHLGQWSGMSSASGQYPVHPPSHLPAEYSTQAAAAAAVHHGYPHGNVADWSQYPLFSYSCW